MYRGHKLALHMPWGSGLGTLGWSCFGHYRDIRLTHGHVYLFSVKYNALDGKIIDQRSTYRLDRYKRLFKWTLLRREDRWGEYKQKRGFKPHKLDLPLGGISQRAWELRLFFAPYQIIDWYGKPVEVISFPCPNDNSVSVMMRRPNDPTTLTEVVLEDYSPC